MTDTFDLCGDPAVTPQVIRAVRGLRHWTQSFTKVHPPSRFDAGYAYIDAADAVSRAWREDVALPGAFVTTDLLGRCEDLRAAYVDGQDLNHFPDFARVIAVEALTAHHDVTVAALAEQDAA